MSELQQNRGEIKGIVHTKNENAVIIYLLSCRSKIFLSVVKHTIYFFGGGESILSNIVWLQTFFKMSSFVFHQKSYTGLERLNLAEFVFV